MARAALLVIWLGAASLAGVVALVIYDLKQSPTVRPKPVAIERLPAKQRHNPAARWSVTEHLSAHNVLIAQVETEHLNEAVSIAQQLTEPLKDRYAEVLIYFHRPGRPDTLPPRRVQWTPASGYLETVYDE
jgi:hypothetical protein